MAHDTWTEELRKKHGEFGTEIRKGEAEEKLEQGWIILCELSRPWETPNGATGEDFAYIILSENGAESYGNSRLLAEASDPTFKAAFGSSGKIERRFFIC